MSSKFQNNSEIENENENERENDIAPAHRRRICACMHNHKRWPLLPRYCISVVVGICMVLYIHSRHPVGREAHSALELLRGYTQKVCAVLVVHVCIHTVLV